jgi:hypothetical protein
MFNCIVNSYDKKNRNDLLNTLNPLEEFERYTQIKRETTQLLKRDTTQVK